MVFFVAKKGIFSRVNVLGIHEAEGFSIAQKESLTSLGILDPDSGQLSTSTRSSDRVKNSSNATGQRKR
jgi:hypothetical protein